MSTPVDERCELLCLDADNAEAVRRSLGPVQADEGRAALAGALADPTRLRVARALAEGGELCVCDLAWICDVSRNLASHHARQLRSAGMATSRREGKLVLYRLTDPGVELLRALLSVSARNAEVS